MIQKVKLTFDEHNVLQSTASTLIRDFDLDPSILKAEIDDGVGVMIIDISGKKEAITSAIAFLKEKGISVDILDDKHIIRDHAKCFSCGACTSMCIVHALAMDPVTYEVHVHHEKCISCGKCLTACPVRALTLKL